MAHLQLSILLFIFSITVVKCAYVHLGCFRDNPQRAISGGFQVFHHNEVIRKCYEKAKRYGNKYFAVQYNRECFTSRDAGNTYHKYGRTSGCRYGRGGSWRQDVYKVKDNIAQILGRYNSNYERRWNDGIRTCTGACEQEYDSLAGDMEQAALGLEAAQSMLDLANDGINNKQFRKIAGLMSKVGPYLGGVGVVVGIIGSFGDSEEMQRLNFIVEMLSEGFQGINNRFNQIEFQIDEVKALLHKQHIDTRNYDDVNLLVNVNKLVERYFKAVKDNDKYWVDRTSQDILRQKDKVWDAVETLINTFTGAADYELCMTLGTATHGDRQEVMTRVIRLYTKLIQGVSDYLLIERFNDPRGVARLKNEYNRKLNNVYNTIAKCDRALEGSLWRNYWKSDLVAAMGDYPKDRRNQLADTIDRKLSSKYYYRHWLTAVYNDWYGGNNHWNMRCSDGWHKLHWKSRYNIIVNSVSPSKSTYASKLDVHFPYKNDARKLWESIPGHIRTCTYPISGVIKHGWGHDPALRTPPNRTYFKKFGQRHCWQYWYWFSKRTKCKNGHNFMVYILG